MGVGDGVNIKRTQGRQRGQGRSTRQKTGEWDTAGMIGNVVWRRVQ